MMRIRTGEASTAKKVIEKLRRKLANSAAYLEAELKIEATIKEIMGKNYFTQYQKLSDDQKKIIRFKMANEIDSNPDLLKGDPEELTNRLAYAVLYSGEASCLTLKYLNVAKEISKNPQAKSTQKQAASPSKVIQQPANSNVASRQPASSISTKIQRAIVETVALNITGTAKKVLDLSGVNVSDRSQAIMTIEQAIFGTFIEYRRHYQHLEEKQKDQIKKIMGKVIANDHSLLTKDIKSEGGLIEAFSIALYRVSHVKWHLKDKMRKKAQATIMKELTNIQQTVQASLQAIPNSNDHFSKDDSIKFKTKTALIAILDKKIKDAQWGENLDLDTICKETLTKVQTDNSNLTLEQIDIAKTELNESLGLSIPAQPVQAASKPAQPTVVKPSKQEEVESVQQEAPKPTQQKVSESVAPASKAESPEANAFILKLLKGAKDQVLEKAQNKADKVSKEVKKQLEEKLTFGSKGTATKIYHELNPEVKNTLPAEETIATIEKVLNSVLDYSSYQKMDEDTKQTVRKCIAVTINNNKGLLNSADSLNKLKNQVIQKMVDDGLPIKFRDPTTGNLYQPSHATKPISAPAAPISAPQQVVSGPSITDRVNAMKDKLERLKKGEFERCCSYDYDFNSGWQVVSLVHRTNIKEAENFLKKAQHISKSPELQKQFSQIEDKFNQTFVEFETRTKHEQETWNFTLNLTTEFAQKLFNETKENPKIQREIFGILQTLELFKVEGLKSNYQKAVDSIFKDLEEIQTGLQKATVKVSPATKSTSSANGSKAKQEAKRKQQEAEFARMFPAVVDSKLETKPKSGLKPEEMSDEEFENLFPKLPEDENKKVSQLPRLKA